MDAYIIVKSYQSSRWNQLAELLSRSEKKVKALEINLKERQKNKYKKSSLKYKKKIWQKSSSKGEQLSLRDKCMT